MILAREGQGRVEEGVSVMDECRMGIAGKTARPVAPMMFPT